MTFVCLFWWKCPTLFLYIITMTMFRNTWNVQFVISQKYKRCYNVNRHVRGDLRLYPEKASKWQPIHHGFEKKGSFSGWGSPQNGESVQIPNCVLTWEESDIAIHPSSSSHPPVVLSCPPPYPPVDWCISPSCPPCYLSGYPSFKTEKKVQKCVYRLYYPLLRALVVHVGILLKC